MKQIFRLFFCMIFTVCQSQENNENNCEAVSVSSEILQWQYMGFMKDSAFYKGEFANFHKVKNGILLYKWQEGIGSSRFFTIDFDKDFNLLIKTENLTEKIDFSIDDKKRLKFIVEILQKESYYQHCRKDDGHANLYVLVVRSNDEMKVQYYSPWASPLKVETSDSNINSIQKIVEIIEQNFYRNISLEKSKKKRKGS